MEQTAPLAAFLIGLVISSKAYHFIAAWGQTKFLFALAFFQFGTKMMEAGYEEFKQQRKDKENDQKGN